MKSKDFEKYPETQTFRTRKCGADNCAKRFAVVPALRELVAKIENPKP